MDDYQIIKKPLHSEKSVSARESFISYYFEVDNKANKIQIKNAIEKLFSVKVDHVRTSIRKGKTKRRKNVIGTTRTWKKAMVSLKGEDRIDLGY